MIAATNSTTSRFVLGHAVELVGLRGQVHHDLCFGDVVRLANFPRDQNQSCNNHEVADGLREFAPIIAVCVSGIRWWASGAILAQADWGIGLCFQPSWDSPEFHSCLGAELPAIIISEFMLT